MTSDEIKLKAKEFADDSLVNHWQARVKAEKDNSAPWGQITTVKDCYEYGYLGGYTQGRADAWRWIPVSERLPEECGNYLTVSPRWSEMKDFSVAWFNPDMQAWEHPNRDIIAYWLPIINLPGGEND